VEHRSGVEVAAGGYADAAVSSLPQAAVKRERTRINAISVGFMIKSFSKK